MKILLKFLLLLLPSFLFAQNVELTVQTGHSASINDVVFSPDNKLLATSGNDNKIVLWDFNTGKQFHALLGHCNKVTQVVFSSNSEQIFSCSLDSTVRVWDINSGVCTKVIKFDYPLGCLQLTNNEEFLWVGGKYISKFSLYSEEIKAYEFRAKHIFNSLDLTDNEDLIAFGGEKEQFAYIIDIKNEVLVRKFVSSIQEVKFDNKSNTMFYSTSDGRVVEYNLTSRKNKSSTTNWMLNSINALEFNDETLFASNDKGEITLYDRANKWKVLGKFISKKSSIRGLDISLDGQFIAAAGDNRTVVIWDIQKGQVVKSLTGLVHRINDIAFSEDGSEILVGYANGIVRKTNLISNQTIVNRILPKSEIIGNKTKYSVVRIEAFNDSLAMFTMLYKRASLVYEDAFDKIEEFKVYWDLHENLLTLEKSKTEKANIEQYVDNLKKGFVGGPYYFLDTTLTRAKNDSLGIYMKTSGNELIACYTENNQICFKRDMGHSDIVTSVAINPRYGYVATASWDGMIRFWDVKTGELLTVYGAFGNGQFVYLNDEGYYYSSKNALDYIGFKLGNQLFSFEQFDLKYNRPDIVAKSLPYFNEDYVQAYYGAYKKRLKLLGIKEEEVGMSANLPILKVEKKIEEGKEKDVLILDISCKDEKFNLDKLHLKVNGVPEFSRFGKQLTGKEYSEKYRLALNPGTNYIQMNVTNIHGVSSYKKSFKVESLKRKMKSDLYLVSIGVSAYEQKQYNLNYARKDAEDIANFFNETPTHFDNVYIETLLDQEVTKSNIENLEKFMNQSNENDVVILFAAGHGVLDVNLDYFFAAHDMDFNAPKEKGIPYELFEDLLDNIKSRKKVMFIDACHSGEIDKDEVVENIVAEEENGELTFRGVNRSISNKYDINSFDLSRSLFADMRLNNGSTVVSSAGGSEFAIEGDEWNNGVFTFTFLKGIRDKEADLNGDKIIMLSELQTYIQFEVNQITNGLQTPTSRVENLNNDFRMR